MIPKASGGSNAVTCKQQVIDDISSALSQQ